VSVIDGNIAQKFLSMSADAVSSITTAPYVGTLGKVRRGLNFSQCSVGGMMQSMRVHPPHFNHI